MRRLVLGGVTGVAAVTLCLAVAGCGDSQDAAGAAAGAAQGATGQAQGAAGQAAGAGLDAAKQQVQNVLQVNPITFTTQSAELSAEDNQALQQIAGVLKTTGASVTVLTHAGYPDAARSQELSQRRADNIVRALTGAGVDAAKVKSQPTGNTTAQGDEALKVQITVP